MIRNLPQFVGPGAGCSFLCTLENPVEYDVAAGAKMHTVIHGACKLLLFLSEEGLSDPRGVRAAGAATLLVSSAHEL